MLTILMKYVIVPLVIINVLYLLHQKGIIRAGPPFFSPVYSCWKGRRSLKARFSMFGGSKVYNYMLKRNKPITFHYNIELEEGSLILTIRTTQGDLFDQVFTGSAKGSIEIIPKTKLHSIVLNGKYAKGNCHCEFKNE